MKIAEALERIALLKALVERSGDGAAPSEAEMKAALKALVELFGQLVTDTMYIASSR